MFWNVDRDKILEDKMHNMAQTWKKTSSNSIQLQ